MFNIFTIKNIEENDCTFFKEFHSKYHVITFYYLISCQVDDEYLEKNATELPYEFEYEINKLYVSNIARGIVLTRPNIDDNSRSISFTNSFNSSFPDKTYTDIYFSINNIQQFFAIFSLTEGIILNLLKENGYQNLKNYEIPKILFEFLDQNNLTSNFFQELNNNTPIYDKESFEAFWTFIRKIRNIIGHTFGILSDRNIEDLKNAFYNFYNSLPNSRTNNLFKVLLTLEDDFQDLKKDNFIKLSDDIWNFSRSFFIFLFEGLNTTLK